MNLVTLHGDCLVELAKLPVASVHCVITSPPYWALRKGEYDGQDTKDRTDGSQSAGEVKKRILDGMAERIVVGYRPTCRCQAGRRRAVVLDPFGGTGTVGEVAIQEGRDAILIEIGDDYIPQLKTRTTNLQPRFL